MSFEKDLSTILSRCADDIAEDLVKALSIGISNYITWSVELSYEDKVYELDINLKEKDDGEEDEL